MLLPLLLILLLLTFWFDIQLFSRPLPTRPHFYYIFFPTSFSRSRFALDIFPFATHRLK